MAKKRTKYGFAIRKTPQPGYALSYTPPTGQFAGHNNVRQTAGLRSEPLLQHGTALENKALKLSMIADKQHPMNALPPALRRRMRWFMTVSKTTPTMTNYSNLEAPTPMSPQDRPV